ncbi:putative ribonuclease H-like domain-containing protein [Tanacetum coccineum]
MNYEPVTVGNQTNGDAGIETNVNAGQAGQEKASDHEYILLPLMLSNSPLSSSTQSIDDKDADEVPYKGDDDKEGYANSTKRDSTASPSVSTAGPNINTASPIPNDSSMQSLENTGIFDDAYDDREVGAEADLNNLETTMNVSPIPTTRIHKDHPKDQIIGDINSATQTRRMTKIFEEHAMVSYIKKQRRTNHKDYQNCLFACFLSQIEPKKVIQALTDPSWIEAMQEELLQFKLQKVWTLVDLPKGKRAIGTKIEAIRLFLAYASFMGLIVYQMDVKSAFLYGTIEEEVYVCQPPGFEDPQFPDKVYKVEKALYGLHQAPRAWSTKKSLCVEFEQMMHKRFQMSSMGELTFFLGLQVQQKEDGIFISQDKYVADILKKFDFTTVKAASTPIETNKALNKDEEAEDIPSYTKDFTPSCMIMLELALTGSPQQEVDNFLAKDETIYKEWEDIMERAAITASSLEADQDSGSGPRSQDTILGGVEAQIRFEAASKQGPIDLPLQELHTRKWRDTT